MCRRVFGSLEIFFAAVAFLNDSLFMGMRREARERAVQFLFQYDLNKADNLDEALKQFWDSQRSSVLLEEKAKSRWGETMEMPPATADEAAMRLFADPLIRGTLEHLTDLDAKITHYTKNWDLNRMAVVDRNILRLAVYEMLYRTDIPPVVSINEAVDIAKRFSTDESGRFVNGILDKVKGDLLRPARIVK